MAGIDSYAKLVLHGDGTDESITIVDSSLSPKSPVASGDAQLDTAQQKFGSASILFDGTGDYATVPDSDDWYFGADDFTIDFWVRFSAIATNGRQTIYAQFVDNNNRTYAFFRDNAGEQTWNMYYIENSITSVNIAVAPAAAVSINTWYHMAFVRNGSSFSIYQDGVLCGSAASVTADFGNIAAAITLGRYPDSTPVYYLFGWLDELRISKGIARWTENFTPPTEAYTEDTDVTLTDGSQIVPLSSNDGILFTGFTYTAEVQISPAFSNDSVLVNTIPITLTDGDQVFPSFSNQSFTGWISDQETPQFDVSGLLVISPVLNAESTVPAFSSTGTMITGIVMDGAATYSGFSCVANEISDNILIHNANFPVFKNNAQLSIGGRFDDYILRYAR